MTRFQISNEPWGYVVEAYYPDKDGTERWLPLRNFGDRQGDAIDFRDIDCPELTDVLIRGLINRYNPQVRYVRHRKHVFFKQD